LVLLNSCSETVFVLFQLSLKTMVSYVIRPRNQSYLYYRLGIKIEIFICTISFFCYRAAQISLDMAGVVDLVSLSSQYFFAEMGIQDSRQGSTEQPRSLLFLPG